MRQYIFNFGVRHKLGRYHQPVFADNHHQAKQKMINKYGLAWSSQFSKEDWETLIKLGREKTEELDPIK